MSQNSRDRRVIEHILAYCIDIQSHIARFGNSYECFLADSAYRSACALCAMQIGELVGSLSDSFKDMYIIVPWKQIKALRNIIAHHYGSIESETLWEIMCDDIPDLKSFCENLIRES